MRGIISEAMVMCASSPEQVEILDPPPDSIPGERISCEGFTGWSDKKLTRLEGKEKHSCLSRPCCRPPRCSAEP